MPTGSHCQAKSMGMLAGVERGEHISGAAANVLCIAPSLCLGIMFVPSWLGAALAAVHTPHVW